MISQRILQIVKKRCQVPPFFLYKKHLFTLVYHTGDRGVPGVGTDLLYIGTHVYIDLIGGGYRACASHMPEKLSYYFVVKMRINPLGV